MIKPRKYAPPTMMAYKAETAWGQDVVLGTCTVGENPSGFSCVAGTGVFPGACNTGADVGNPTSCSSGSQVPGACITGNFVDGFSG